MYNWVLIDKLTGRVINALSTPTKGVTLTPEDENQQEVMEITLEDFNAILNGEFKYWNYETQEFEPEETYKWVLITPAPYLPGLVILTFKQYNWKEVSVVKPVLVTVTVNGEIQQVQVEDGTLELEIDCPEPMTLRIKLESERHKTFENEVVIGG